MTLAPDVILANTNPAARALRDVTQTIPIVFSQLIDPVRTAWYQTSRIRVVILRGSPAFEYAMGGKWLEALKEIAPGLTRGAGHRWRSPAECHCRVFNRNRNCSLAQYRMQITQANVIQLCGHRARHPGIHARTEWRTDTAADFRRNGPS